MVCVKNIRCVLLRWFRTDVFQYSWPTMNVRVGGIYRRFGKERVYHWADKSHFRQVLLCVQIFCGIIGLSKCRFSRNDSVVEHRNLSIDYKGPSEFDSHTKRR